MSSFEEAVQHERGRLVATIADAREKIAELQDQVASDERRIEALDAYERVKVGKQAGAKGGKKASSKRPKAANVLDMLQGSDGVTLDQILGEAGVEPGSPEAASISLSLQELERKGRVVLEDGIYTVP